MPDAPSTAAACIADHLPVALYRCAQAGMWPVALASGDWAGLCGRSCSEIQSAGGLLTLVHPEDRGWVEAKRRAELVERGTSENDYRIIHRDGSERWVCDRCRRTPAGSVEGMLLDIGQRKRAERDLLGAYAQARQSEAFFTLSNVLPCIAGFDGRFRRVGPQWSSMLGWREDELLDRPFLEFVHPDDRMSTIAATISAQRAGESVRGFANRYRTRSGEWRWLLWHSHAHTDNQTIYAVAVDITRQKALEDQLHQVQKLDAIGQLAGGVAHDFNNLLLVMRSHLELLREDGADRERGLAAIGGAVDRAADLTRQLLTLGRRAAQEPVAIDLNQVVREQEGLLRRVIGEHIRLDVRPAAAPVVVRADGNQLHQVVMNLAVNARDAMSAGGSLEVAVAETAFAEDELAGMPGAKPGPYALLRISDTGTGMDAATHARLFEPFFTTKPAGRGTGLGLATVRGIVVQSGGFVQVASEPGGGTVVSVHLPLQRGLVPQGRGGVPERPPAPAGGELVLLVEDEPEVREVVGELLRRAGFVVVETADGHAALAELERLGPQVRALVTDVVMPRLGGVELVARARTFLPRLPVLFTSGYSPEQTPLPADGAPTSFLEKPYPPLELARRIRELIG